MLGSTLPTPLRMPFEVDLVLVAAAMLAVLLVPETVCSRALGWPRPRRPAIAAQARPVFVPAAIATFAAFAVFGLLAAVEPGILANVLHLPGRALAGAVVFTMFGAFTIGVAVLAVAALVTVLRLERPPGAREASPGF
jgi:hypothetical protein